MMLPYYRLWDDFDEWNLKIAGYFLCFHHLHFFVIVRGYNQEYLIPTSFGVDNIYDARNLIALVLLLLWKNTMIKATGKETL